MGLWASLFKPLPSCQLGAVLLSMWGCSSVPAARGVPSRSRVRGADPCPLSTPRVGGDWGEGDRCSGWGLPEVGEERPQRGQSRWPGLQWKVSW